MNYQNEYERWLTSTALTEKEKDELRSISHDSKTKELRFSFPMNFGTAGLRSTMNMGIGCMNRFTVAETTRALASLIKSAGGSDRGVVIAYDSRNNSELFAKVSASVLAFEGIRVYIFDSLRPTPELSFAVRELSCIAGINITASHNPKEYNGYKAYWEDGAQIGPEQAKIISEKRAEFDTLDFSGADIFEDAVKDGRITVLGSDFDEKYISEVLKTANTPSLFKECGEDLKVVYTPLHGAGYRLVPLAFERLGIKKLYTVAEQMIPDGDFPTVIKPNPEYEDAFALGIKLADKVKSDLVIATDPDADRVGVVARDTDGRFVTISGNQMGALLLDYVIRAKREANTLKDNAYAVKSIVSTDMAYKIATENGVKLYDVLTGFKFIGEVIKNYEKEGADNQFLLGFEESYGYLLGTYARDKDSVGASLMILEMTAYYKKQNMTLCDALRALYERYGYYVESTVDIYMEGLDGIEKRRRVMLSQRDEIPTEIGGVRVKAVGDYLSGTVTDLQSNISVPTGQPVSDVLYYVLENDDKIIVRPSGTEPKIKIYVLAHGDSKDALDEKMKIYKESAVGLAEA